jgi:hypothetical protein
MQNISHNNPFENTYPIFHGLKIAEIEGVLAIGYLSKVLIEFGAEVILLKLDNQDKKNARIEKNSEFFDFLNEGKQILNFDLEILKNCDVLFGEEHDFDCLNFDNLKKINEKLIIMKFAAENSNNKDNNDFKSCNNYNNCDTALTPFKQLIQALVLSKANKKESLTVVKAESPVFIHSLDNKENFKQCAHVTIASQNFSFLYFEMQKDKNFKSNALQICERLYLEVLNLDNLPINTRLELTEEYIEQLNLKKLNERIFCSTVKKLCKFLKTEKILKLVKNMKNLNVSVNSVSQYDDIVRFIQAKNCKERKCLSINELQGLITDKNNFVPKF